MRVEALRFDPREAWSVPLPAIDSERTLVLAFGAPSFAEARRLIDGAGLVGFYSYGEISPFSSGRHELHDQTTTLTRLWEA